VGQDGILRGDWQSPRVPVANRHAACQAAPQKDNFTRSRYQQPLHATGLDNGLAISLFVEALEVLVR
jgi:hypothetical protein